MKYGIIIDASAAQAIVELAVEAEAALWDGVFISDALAIETKTVPAFPWFDPWVVLAAIAMRTERVRLGTFITAVPRRRPWKLARETATLDHLSHGRLILAVGLGAAADDGGFYKVGEAMELKVRAERLDEGLAIIDGLWSGKPFSYSGQHFRVEEMTMLPPPVQSPRIPVWVVGVWPKEKSMRRALRWDGVIPQTYTPKPDDIRAIRKLAEEQHPLKTSFDIVVGGTSSGGKRKRTVDKVRPLAEAGATWWIEHTWADPRDPEEKQMSKIRARIKQGPPRLD